MTLGERAVEYHVPGTNCAQCILLAAKEYTGLSADQCMRIGMGFGGGLRSGEICGAISGAVMCLGLCGKGDAKTVKDFVSTFREFNGCVRCIELKGHGIPCDDLILYAGNLLEENIK